LVSTTLAAAVGAAPAIHDQYVNRAIVVKPLPPEMMIEPPGAVWVPGMSPRVLPPTAAASVVETNTSLLMHPIDLPVP